MGQILHMEMGNYFPLQRSSPVLLHYDGSSDLNVQCSADKDFWLAYDIHVG